MMPIALEHFAQADVCYLTTTGRHTGHPHTIEIWFALHESTLYMLSGGGIKGADWVKNILRQPQVKVKITNRVFMGRGRLVKAGKEDERARQLIGEKYRKTEEDLDAWLKSALPVAVDLSL
jgi:deazaflavin-dependent oxidoreductase (nitroreductase family)